MPVVTMPKSVMQLTSLLLLSSWGILKSAQSFQVVTCPSYIATPSSQAQPRRSLAMSATHDRGGRGGRGGNSSNGRPPNRDFRGDFGANGHDYKELFSAGPISSLLSLERIHSKVSERLMAKMNRDFETADRIQLKLAEDGVFINDRTKEWRADGVQFIDPSEGRRVPSDRNRAYVQSRHSEAVPEGAQYTVDRIGQLVMERSQHKLDNKFLKADSIRDGLARACNVFIDDRVREWSIGGSFGIDADTKRAHSVAVKSRNYVRSSSSLELPAGVTVEDVQVRVDARTRARNDRQYEQSDAIREEILQDFNVVIHDFIKMWSVGGDFGLDDPVKARATALSTYNRRGGGILSLDEVNLIQGKLTERSDAKKARNFDKADEIRSHLYNMYNVNVDDKSREWRVLCDDYVQTNSARGAKELTPQEVSIVDSKIARRAVFKRDKEYKTADAIRDELEDTYSVLIDDKTKEWKVVPSGQSSSFTDDVARSQSSSYKLTHVINDNQRFDSTKRADDVPEPHQIDIYSGIDVDTSDVVLEEGRISSLSRDQLMSLTVPLLKEKLRETGKPVSGKKADLIDRLLA